MNASKPAELQRQIREAMRHSKDSIFAESRVFEEYLVANAWRYALTMDQLTAAHGRSLVGASVLDIGSYPGHLAAVLQRFECAQVHAVSLMTNAAFEECMGELGIRVSLCDVERDPLPAPDGTIDIVLCCELIEHLDGDVMHMLREARRIMAPGGFFLLTTPNHASMMHRWNLLRGRSVYPILDNPDYPFYAGAGVRNPMRHIREFTLEEIGGLLKAAGFRSASTITSSPPLTNHSRLSWRGEVLTRGLRALERLLAEAGTQMIAIARP